jgi:hypothetical protein
MELEALCSPGVVEALERQRVLLASICQPLSPPRQAGTPSSLCERVRWNACSTREAEMHSNVHDSR